MTVLDEINKGIELAKKQNAINQGIPQVSVPNMTTAPVVGTPVATTDAGRAKWGERQKQKDSLIEAQAALIAKLTSELNNKSATQLPVVAPVILPTTFVAAPVVPEAPVEMTHVAPYPAKFDNLGRMIYQASAKWYAKVFPKGSKVYASGGISIDSAISIRSTFPNPADFYKSLDPFIEEYGHTSKIYQTMVAGNAPNKRL